MRLLWIATKLPEPPVDGGRLVQSLTLDALAEEGVEVDLLAPSFPGECRLAAAEALTGRCKAHLVPVGLEPSLPTWTRALFSFSARLPLAIVRHAHPAVRRRAGALLDAGRFDAVHVEQLHALPQAAAAALHGVPVVLRAQNVESDLWFAAAARLPLPWRWLAQREAHRLARWEGRAVARVAKVVALTRNDAKRLGELMPAGRPTGGEREIEVIAAPFPRQLPAGPTRPLAGSPAIVLLASGDWPPNRDSRRFMVEEVWPHLHRRLPSALLHVFGGAGEAPAQVVHHSPPADSGEIFAAGSILAVSLRIASGVRMKILEAWARGVAVVATPQAAAGLEAEDGRELLIAGDAASFAAAVARVALEPGLRERLTAGGQALLAAHHDPRRIGRELADVYRRAARRQSVRQPR